MSTEIGRAATELEEVGRTTGQYTVLMGIDKEDSK